MSGLKSQDSTLTDEEKAALDSDDLLLIFSGTFQPQNIKYQTRNI